MNMLNNMKIGFFVVVISVPYSKSGIVPRSSLFGAGKLGRVGQLGEGWGK
jgi:hypothetical protein